jgi:hypothetical protein
VLSATTPFSGAGRTASYAQTGGKNAHAMLAMDAIFHF